MSELGTVEVIIEHCSQWGYGPRAQALKDKILSVVTDANVNVKAGRATSYEIIINGDLIFSKLETGQFPDDAVLIEEIRAVASGQKKPETVTEYERGCCIL